MTSGPCNSCFFSPRDSSMASNAGPTLNALLPWPSLSSLAQMLAYPLADMPGLPWAVQPVMGPLAHTANALAGLHTSVRLQAAITAFAACWVAWTGALVAACWAHCYKERHAGAMPIKVCGSLF